MNPELKQKWLEALRSGKYMQGIGALCVNDYGKQKYCCLGVLAEVACVEKTENAVGGANYRINGMMHTMWLSDGFAGLSFGQQANLSRMNDGGATFAEIANLIEKTL